VVAFQPHRYSRTRDLFAEFLSSFDDAAVVLLTDIYAAGEDKVEGVSSEALYYALKKRGHLDVRHIPERPGLAEALLDIVQDGDLVITLGAGDIHRTADELLGLLRSGRSPRQLH
jgi:UDP-N-acetylmuramate--alanine ligase